MATREQIEEWAWQDFATAYPHEAAEMDFAKFAAFVRTQNPAVSDEEIRLLLKETVP